MTTCDVLVAGGGSAAIAAAVAAARHGADTLLVERSGMLGGMGTTALVHTICGLFLIRDEPGIAWANPGFAREFATRLLDAGGARPPVRMGRLDVMPHEPTAFAALADHIVRETPRLRVWLHAELVGVNENFDAVEIACRGRRDIIRARAFIDATGDASLTALGGAAFEQADARLLQRPAYIVRVRGMPPHVLDDAGRLVLAHATALAVKANDLPREALGSTWRTGAKDDEAFLTIDLAGGNEGGGAWDPCSPEMLATVEMTGRRTASALIGHLRTRMEGFSSCHITQWPCRAGVRESRRVTGVYKLSAEDILGGAMFDDAVARATWPMELREVPTGPRWKYPERNAPCGIPLRALRHRDIENLWVAGRCISCSHEAQASIRVIGTCMATGEATGIAAAASLDGIRGWENLANHVRNRRIVAGDA